MADLKISQLTGASTPLTGTEEVPLVQSGATKKVSVANLTAGRGVSLGGTSAVDTPYSFGGNNYGLAVTSSGNPSAYLNNEFGSGQFEFGGYYNGAGQYKATNTSYSAINIGPGTVDIYGDTGLTIGNTFARTKFGTFTGGNYVPAAAAKGVNFTANTPAAGMTSQLLNWYEEGTWTPDQGAGLTVVGAFSSTGRYTRIGRQVTVSGTVTGATSVAVTAAGIVTTNLPFTVVTAGHGNATNAAVNASAAVICTTTNVTSASAIAATGTITFSATYFV